MDTLVVSNRKSTSANSKCKHSSRLRSAGSQQAEPLYTPPKSAYRKRECGPSIIRKFYSRGDLPLILGQNSKGNHILWKEDLDKLDYETLLPIFFDGLSETEHPYNFFARQGIHDLLTRVGNRVVPIIPRLIPPIKKALNTRDVRCICVTLKVLQHLVTCSPGVGEALIPFFRQILPIFNTFRAKNSNCGDEIEYGQRKNENVGDLIQETLECLERHGGLDAFINIKYIIPTYESCFYR